MVGRKTRRAHDLFLRPTDRAGFEPLHAVATATAQNRRDLIQRGTSIIGAPSFSPYRAHKSADIPNPGIQTRRRDISVSELAAKAKSCSYGGRRKSTQIHVGTRNDIGVPNHSEFMKMSRIPREQNPYFLTGRGKKKVWFAFWTYARKNSR